MSKSDARKIVKSFVLKMKQDGFPFERVYLFGSYAKGLNKKWSDIDVCVVSNKFAGKNWDSYERRLWRLRREIDSRIEPIGMTNEEFSGLSPLSEEVRKTGIRMV
ncbi:nucleotidyltransferase domain-containing protein [Candidatus Peregrinibacteria bacterium]|nr:nucleotidyltransferase domain-containing protein [Candidatus Peregrinibacteria bacterium]